MDMIDCVEIEISNWLLGLEKEQVSERLNTFRENIDVPASRQKFKDLAISCVFCFVTNRLTEAQSHNIKDVNISIISLKPQQPKKQYDHDTGSITFSGTAIEHVNVYHLIVRANSIPWEDGERGQIEDELSHMITDLVKTKKYQIKQAYIKET